MDPKSRHSPHEQAILIDALPPSPRSFGFCMSAAIGFLGVLLAVWGHPVGAAISGATAVLLLVAAMRFAESLRTLNLLWFRFGLALHGVVSPVVLLVVFVAAVLPTAVVARLFRLVDFPLRPDSQLATYWLPSKSGTLRFDRQY